MTTLAVQLIDLIGVSQMHVSRLLGKSLTNSGSASSPRPMTHLRKNRPIRHRLTHHRQPLSRRPAGPRRGDKTARLTDDRLVPPAAGVIANRRQRPGVYLSQGARWTSGVAAHRRPRPRVLPAPSSASTTRMAA